MEREEEIQRAASAETLTAHGTHSHLDDIPFIDLSYDEIAESAFVKGAKWADEHPQKTDGCDFCNKLAGVNHESDECYLSYNNDILTIDVDMPLTWGSTTNLYSFNINYCPFCGRKLK